MWLFCKWCWCWCMIFIIFLIHRIFYWLNSTDMNFNMASSMTLENNWSVLAKYFCWSFPFWRVVTFVIYFIFDIINFPWRTDLVSQCSFDLFWIFTCNACNVHYVTSQYVMQDLVIGWNFLKLVGCCLLLMETYSFFQKLFVQVRIHYC